MQTVASIPQSVRPLPSPSTAATPLSRPGSRRNRVTGRDVSRAHQAAEERLLVARLLQNDPEAWRSFTAEYSPVIIGCIRRVLSRFSRVTSDHDVDEVYARFCCDLLKGDRRKLRRFDPAKGSRLSTWMGLLATNATYDYLRGIKRDRVVDPMPEGDTLQSGETSPYEDAVLRERAAIAGEILDNLSERDRQFVELYFGEGLDAELVSAKMGISVKTVYTKKHKITARLERLVAGIDAA